MDNFLSYVKRILLLLILSQLNLHCQMQPKLPEFRTEICHPNKKYPITPVFDYIKTQENSPAGLPYGSSSGTWGSSGKMWTAQKGTPIGFEITYYAHYEDKYYYIDANFDVEYIKKMANRCYPTSDLGEKPTQEYISLKEFNDDFEVLRDTYSPFTTLVFGFAPKGMVVVWMCYSYIAIDIGRFQAKEITDKKRIEECKKKYVSTYRIDGNRYEEAIIENAVPNASPLLWDNYRIKYNWKYEVGCDDTNFRFLGLTNEYFNGEKEQLFRPTLLTPVFKKKAIPEVMTLYWETNANERYEGKLFFDWDKTNILFKEAGENATLKIHINENNTDIKLFLNDKEIEINSIRMYSQSEMRFRDSFKER
jgi:hypothetical protein